MKGLLTVRFTPARNISVPTPAPAAPQHGMGDGTARVGEACPPAALNPHPDAVTPNATTKEPAMPDFGKGDFKPTNKDQFAPDNGHHD